MRTGAGIESEGESDPGSDTTASRETMSRPVVLIPSYRPTDSTKPQPKNEPVRHRQDVERKHSNGAPSTHKPFRSAQPRTVIEDSADEGSAEEESDSAEEEIVTAGARATLNHSPPRRVVSRPISYETHLQPGEEPSEEATSESESEESDPQQPQDTKPRHVGFPLVEELPDWFPQHIKQMYRVDRHGGALSYKASLSSLLRILSDLIQELNDITRYRTTLEIKHRRKWRRYIKAGKARWQLQQTLHHLKRRPLTKRFFEYRKEQYKAWKTKALELWKPLEKYHQGILILNETININFRQERIIHEKHLRGGRR